MSGSSAESPGGRGPQPAESRSVDAPLFASEIGAELCRHRRAPFAAVFSRVSESEENWSLRSRGGFAVGRVAQSLGGGVHRAATGFRVARWRSEVERRMINSGGA